MVENTVQQGQIRIKKIRVKDLYEFARRYSDEKKPDDIDVLAVQRAQAQSLNPNADEHDIGLLLAYKGESCVGYLGLMPGLAEMRGKYEKVIFPTTLFVSPAARGQSVSSLLFKQAILLGRALICTGMSAVAEKIYHSLGFQSLESVHYWEIDLMKRDKKITRFLDRGLRKFGIVNKAQHDSERFLYSRTKKMIYKSLMRKLESDLNQIKYEEVEQIDEAVENNKEGNVQKFYRGAAVINWMLMHKWIAGRNESRAVETGYAFSGVRDHFQYVALKINSLSDESNSGYVVLSISKNNRHTMVKLLDHHLTEKGSERIIFAITMKYAQSVLADSVEISEDIAKNVNIGFLNNIMTKKERRYLYYVSDMSGETAVIIKQMHTDYCDGDTPFT